MGFYAISWSVSGKFKIEADSEEEARRKFNDEWKVGAIQPRRDGELSAHRPIERCIVDSGR